MIKFTNTETWGFKHAIRGMRNPLESWSKSDSCTCTMRHDYCYSCEYKNENGCNIDFLHIKEADIGLMKRLIHAGTDHSKFMRQIMVSVDIVAPLYWWKEFDTYKVGTVANSTSTMHKIHSKKFTLDDFSTDHLHEVGIDTMRFTIDVLNKCRESYLSTKNKTHWWQLIQLLPSSYNQTRTVTLNYAVIYNMYHSRKNHKLDEWSVGFIEWANSLPFAKELFLGE